MVKQIKKLTKLLLCNFWGINEVRYGKDKSKKGHFYIAVVGMVVLSAFYMIYIAGASMAYMSMGLNDILPGYMLMLVSVLILFFTIYKAGNIIFQMKSYDMLIAMPLSSTAIVVSRFLTMYIKNVFFSLITFVPFTVVYALFTKAGILFYIMMVLTIFLAPLLPMTIATAIGALIIAISSRTKHKTLVNIMLTLTLVTAILVGSMFSSGMTDAQFEEMMKNMSVVIAEQVNRIYPPAILFSNAILKEHFGYYMIFAGISIGLFVLFVWLVQKYFVSICSLLKVKEGKRNYKITTLNRKSILKALIMREIKHYFSCSVYVINTMVGFLMMTIVGIALLIMGPGNLEEMLGMPGFITKAGAFILAATGTITATSASSISLEGKQYWILQTIPVPKKTILNSKILLNMIIAFPFYMIAEICILLSGQFSLMEGIWMLVIPMVYLVFSSVSGLFMNLQFPVMNWDNETAVVKQSMAVMLSMFLNFVTYAIPIAILLLVTDVNATIVKGVSVVGMLLLTVLIYFIGIASYEIKNA